MKKILLPLEETDRSMKALEYAISNYTPEEAEFVLLMVNEKLGFTVKSEAEAEAIMKVQQATADAIKLINEAAPGDGVIKIKALEAFAKAADGKATKIIIPSELQGLAGLAASAKSVFESDDPKA
jgi:hypothetical protein